MDILDVNSKYIKKDDLLERMKQNSGIKIEENPDIINTINARIDSVEGKLQDVLINGFSNKIWQSDIDSTKSEVMDELLKLSTKFNDRIVEIDTSIEGVTTRVQNIETTITTITPHHIVLSNENQSIITDYSGKVEQETVVSTQIDTFKGVDKLPATIGTVVVKSHDGTVLQIGSITKTNPGTLTSGSVTWTIPANTVFNIDSGYIEIPITIEGKNYIKTLTWNIANIILKCINTDRSWLIECIGHDLFFMALCQ